MRKYLMFWVCIIVADTLAVLLVGTEPAEAIEILVIAFICLYCDDRRKL